VCRKITTDLGLYEIFKNHIIVTVNEAIDLDSRYAPEIIKILKDNMHCPFGWISNKINSYSADPFIMLDVLPEVPMFTSYCGVIYGNQAKDYTTYGKKLVPETFSLASFDALDDAIKWTLDKVKC